MTADDRRDPARRPSTRTRRRSGRRGWGVLAWALVLLAVWAAAGWLWLSLRGGDGRNDLGGLTGEPVAEAPVGGDRAVLVVFPEWDAAGYVTEERQIPSRGRQDEDLLALMRTLCAGPSVSGAVNAIPAGTRALDAFIDPQDHSVVLDFSSELVTGHPGGSLAESATLTSILRTVALNFPAARSCVILIDGAQVETLAGHLEMGRPFDPREWL